MTITTIRSLALLSACAAAAALAFGTGQITTSGSPVASIEQPAPSRDIARGGRPVHLRAANSARPATEPVLTARGTRMRPVVEPAQIEAAATMEIETLTRRGTRMRTVPATGMVEAALR